MRHVRRHESKAYIDAVSTAKATPARAGRKIVEKRMVMFVLWIGFGEARNRVVECKE